MKIQLVGAAAAVVFVWMFFLIISWWKRKKSSGQEQKPGIDITKVQREREHLETLFADRINFYLVFAAGTFPQKYPRAVHGVAGRERAQCQQV